MKSLIKSALLLLLFPPLAQAHHYHSYHNSSQQSRGESNAKVLDSTPVYKYATALPAQRYCQANVIYKPYGQPDTGRSDNSEVTLVGGIVGAVIGTSSAQNIKRTNKSDSHNYQVQQKNCETKYQKSRKVRVLDGYKVTYR